MFSAPILTNYIAHYNRAKRELKGLSEKELSNYLSEAEPKDKKREKMAWTFLLGSMGTLMSSPLIYQLGERLNLNTEYAAYGLFGLGFAGLISAFKFLPNETTARVSVAKNILEKKIQDKEK